ncbi:MAG: T9SS type A sorting domain-containing protein, partial [Candidatus Latescibacteria bacterium]|nr:T9SS type A sorting domain-containing protein [Candidatus Latescibacterota bacterium]
PSGPPTPTAVREERGAGQPGDFALSQNFPNPFNSTTTIRYGLSQAAPVNLSVYNLAGQRVIQLGAGWRQAGNYTARWDGRTARGFALSTGVYIYRLRAGDHVESRKLLLLR